jgi:hypothetical protein
MERTGSPQKTKKKELISRPWGDRTGPWGRGPRTGRGAGYCAGYDVPGYMNPDVPGYGRGRGRGYGGGRGRGMGLGRGRGWGRGRLFQEDPYPPPGYPADDYYPDPYYGPPREPEPEVEKKYLEGVIEHLEKEMVAVKKRIGELAKGEKEEKK